MSIKLVDRLLAFTTVGVVWLSWDAVGVYALLACVVAFHFAYRIKTGCWL